MQLLGEPDHDQAHIVNHRQQHLAQGFGLGRFEPSIRRPVGRQAELPELTQRARQPRRCFAEALLGAGSVDVAAVQQRLNHCGDDDIVVGIQRAHDLGHIQRRAAYQISLRRQCYVEECRHAGMQSATGRPSARGSFHVSDCCGWDKVPIVGIILGPCQFQRRIKLRAPEIATIRVLGIDPGSQRTGFGVLDAAGSRLTYVASGVIRTGQVDFAARLCEIFRCMQTIVAQYQPQEIAIERVFVNRNPDSALKLGQARGAAICGTADSKAGVFEYATRQIKQAVVGSGSAEKSQVQLMMRSILKLDGPVAADAADALAAAVCHALRGRAMLLQAGLRG